jgi:hypothetical protein
MEDATISATIARRKKKGIVDKAKERFEVLYWGPSQLTAEPDVAAAMSVFRRCIQPNSKCDQTLEQLSVAIANACRRSLTHSWRAAAPANLMVQTQ